jgi:hypothetical protein
MMLVKTLQVLVHAEQATLWNLLLDRLRNPQRYLSGITDAHILEETGSQILREMRLRGEVVRELVAIKPRDAELRHELLEHPQFSGVIISRIVPTSVQSPVAPLMLEFEIEVQMKSFHTEGIVKAEDQIVADLEDEMHRLKSRAEEMDARE